MSNKFSIYKDMAMLSDIVYNLNQGKETENGYTIKQSSPANSSGFSATLYQKEDEIILALRGTETNSLEQFYYDVLVADVAELGTKSVPASQVTDMIRFIDGLKNNSDLISENSKVTIVGHSLGGTLAQIASKMYPSLFDNCYTFNSPSRMSLNYRKIYKDSDGKYYWLGNEQINFKHYVEDKIGEAFHNYQNTSMTTSVTDVRAKDVLSMIANLWWKERFAERIEVSGTNSNYGIWKAA